MDDSTIIDRGGRIGPTDEDSAESTVIVRGGRKGIAGPLVYLVQRNGIRAGRVHLLTEEASIGRGSDQDVILSDETVSKRHAKIRVEDGRYLFWDLASANHSYVLQPDGTRTRILEPHELKDGDNIVLGEARLTYLEVDRGLGE
ncbi:MAG: FHA domain-containing protein [Dehalococcoidia bacterium]|nr:FHA domain-containing protein [Dehalococcoidia bacterium]